MRPAFEGIAPPSASRQRALPGAIRRDALPGGNRSDALPGAELGLRREYFCQEEGEAV